MGKKQHQKDKMYLTYTEWSEFYGGHKPDSVENEQIKFKRLPFDHCCVSLVPFEHPYSDKEGNVFELSAIVEFLKRFKVNPVTGAPLDGRELIKLNFTKNHEDQFHCPTLFKPFTKNSHIVANGKTGNVFSYEAIEQEVDEQLAKERAEELERVKQEAEEKRNKGSNSASGQKRGQPLKVFRTGVGKYLDTGITKNPASVSNGEKPGSSGLGPVEAKRLKKITAGTSGSNGFGNFSSW
ncbi:RING-type E3 ubiquitin-protein ligase PPIL2-like [Anopheles bellator]|uniref:RING-type E3 ubiquitin-protein ligase PPIL2-like n=1 Tax=Anopheles bellator TaxID=139047 RepID=UPI002649B842|nr:RING-type E3 ubiquitin-protein ligase PPIL2-like [Anopheles bellator]